MKELEPKITKVDAGSKFVEEIKIVFMHQFPVHERVSLEPFFDPFVEGADAWVLAEGDKVLGFVTLLTLPPISYIFYLATDSAHQGKGVGSRLVNFVKETYPSDLLFLHCEVPLESAPERLQTRLKRLNFYKRLGFKKVGKEHGWRGELFQTMAIGTWDEEKVKKFWERFDPLWSEED